MASMVERSVLDIVRRREGGFEEQGRGREGEGGGEALEEGEVKASKGYCMAVGRRAPPKEG